MSSTQELRNATLDALRKAWDKYPDLRLGELISWSLELYCPEPESVQLVFEGLGSSDTPKPERSCQCSRSKVSDVSDVSDLEVREAFYNIQHP